MHTQCRCRYIFPNFIFFPVFLGIHTSHTNSHSIPLKKKNKSIPDKNNSCCFHWILCGNHFFPLNQNVYGSRRVQIAIVPERKKHMPNAAMDAFISEKYAQFEKKK